MFPFSFRALTMTSVLTLQKKINRIGINDILR